MYQVNIPALYSELKDKKLSNMLKVLCFGTLIAAIAYILVGIFGFTTFALSPNVCELMEAQNILKADYGQNALIKACTIGVLFVVMFASPFCILPVKDSLEELWIKDKTVKFTFKQNFQITLGIITIAYLIAIVVPTIGDAMTILGATTNTFIGFLLPIVFYNKIEGTRKSLYTNDRLFSYLVFVFMVACSFIEIGTYIYKKLQKGDECST